MLLNKKTCPVPAWVQAITNKDPTSSKAAPASRERDDEHQERRGALRGTKRKKAGEGNKEHGENAGKRRRHKTAHLDSDQLRKESEERLAGLKDALQKKKKVGKLSSEPGAILATRAAAVAESSKCKKKTGDKAISILKKAISGKGVEEVDYEDNGHEKDAQ